MFHVYFYPNLAGSGICSWAGYNGDLTGYISFSFNGIQIVPIDIKPETLNLKSKGNYVTAYIEMENGYAVEDIDIATVAITHINDDLLDPPLYTVGPTEIGDYDGDSNPDLMVKFDRQELLDLLEVTDETLTVSGELLDGSPFEGTDEIRVIKRGK